jgi:UDP-glucose 6-dehydrogenase
VREDLQLNIDYLTERLETLKARPPGGSDDGSAEVFEEIYQGMIQLLKFLNKTDERLDRLVGVVTRSLERQARLMGIGIPTYRFASFKPHTDDLPKAPAIEIAEQLTDRGATVTAHDPVALPRVPKGN